MQRIVTDLGDRIIKVDHAREHGTIQYGARNRAGSLRAGRGVVRFKGESSGVYCRTSTRGVRRIPQASTITEHAITAR
jgi:hypothetical protein